MKTSVNFFSSFSMPWAPLLMLLALMTAFNVAALPQTADGETAAITEETVRTKIDAINANQQLDAATKTKLLEIYQTALSNLQALEERRAQIKEYEQAVKLAPAQIKSVKKNLEKTSAALKNQSLESFEGIDTEELEQRLVIERGKLSALEDQTKKIETDLSVQSARLPQIRFDAP
jgi:potassium efflux system protein